MWKDHKHWLDVGVEVELDFLEFVEIRIWAKGRIVFDFGNEWIMFCVVNSHSILERNVS